MQSRNSKDCKKVRSTFKTRNEQQNNYLTFGLDEGTSH